MLLSPLQNTGKLFSQAWLQERPVVTQEFGKNPQVYKQFGLNGHNGTDFRCKVGTPLFAPCDGVAIVKNDGKAGYGMHVKIRSRHGAREVVLGHMSKVVVTDGQEVNMGQRLGDSGNTGFSTGPHLHFGLRFLVPSSKPVKEWVVKDYSNGYMGYVDPLPHLITWKGTFSTNDHN